MTTTEDSYRVLVLDDDPDIAEYTRTVLERRGDCQVRALNDPRLAVAALEEFHPDVVVTDIEMPGMSGLEVLALMREAQPGLPVIVMTAHVSIDYAVRALRSQADEFLTKPISHPELISTVRRLAAQWRSRREADLELDRATEVQRGLLPRQLVALAGYQLDGGCTPARAVGGDFFDWYPVSDGAAFTVADVMGKGIGAAIIAATVRSVLRSRAGEADLGQVMSLADCSLEPDLERAGAFVTLFHARLNVALGEVRYVDAGHGLSLVVRAAGGVKRLATTSFPLGSGLGGGWREHILTLLPGDSLVSVSDGVLDLFDGTLASLDEVERIARSASSARGVVDALLEKASDGAPDDVTVVVLRRDL
ncbi:PP2C family protein-serine/threonine phosphatase [Lacisediminihabitans sp.]|uniref:PP2C family protein-serine/threonine phosphatase n=1 Tax=Lacisediminihabitans sp. TaxID=2787631 RepID=UPI00374D004D